MLPRGDDPTVEELVSIVITYRYKLMKTCQLNLFVELAEALVSRGS